MKTKTITGLLAFALLAALALQSGCTQPSEGAQEATEKIKASSEERQAVVDTVLDTAQKAVGEAADAAGGLEAQLKGFGIKNDLQEIQRELTRAIDLKGQDRIDAVNSASVAFTNLIADVDEAAAAAPEGSEIKTKLNDLSVKMQNIQTSLQKWVANAGAATGSETTTP